MLANLCRLFESTYVTPHPLWYAGGPADASEVGLKEPSIAELTGGMKGCIKTAKRRLLQLRRFFVAVTDKTTSA